MSEEAGVLWDVVEEHLDEAEFLVGRWCAAQRSRHLNRAALVRSTESRLLAHLDGLVLGGAPVADRLLWPVVGPDGEGKPTRRAAAALALLQIDRASAIKRLVDALAAAPAGELRAGLALGLRLCDDAGVDEPLRVALYTVDKPDAQADVLDVLAARNIDPGPILKALLSTDEPRLLAAALTAAANTAGAFQPAVEERMSHADPAVRMAALRTALIWNLRSAWLGVVDQARAGVEAALLLVGLVGTPDDLPLLSAHLASPKNRRAALDALGFLGIAEAADACLPYLADEDERTAATAAHAIATITGLPVHDDAFVGAAKPEPAELPPLEEDLAKDLSPEPADELPPPNPGAITAWWRERRDKFPAKRRYLHGQPATAAGRQDAFRLGPLGHGEPLALEVVIRSAGQVRIPAPRLGGIVVDVPPGMMFDRPPRWR